MLETLGHLCLKTKFKEAMLNVFGSFAAGSFGDSIKFLAMLAVQKNDNSSISNSSLTSSLIFMMLNMARSEDYDLQIPSHTLKFSDELKDKDISYYEMKQLHKTMRYSPQLLGQIT